MTVCQEKDDRNILIVVAGPTAVGKSELAAELARRIRGEVVSADSMQVYRFMDIGSAKVTREEMLGVPHHMIDVADPDEEMDAARYAAMAGKVIREIHERGRIPILCGGTGFYIQAVARDIDFSENAPDRALRARLQAEAEEYGPEKLYRRLSEIDPEAAEAIHPNNIKRVIRALEFYEGGGEKISEHNRREKERESPWNLVYFFIDEDRKTLYERIERRVDFMMETGLEDEVRYLAATGLSKKDVSMQGIGYKEILDALEGNTTMEEAVRLIKRNSRRYAKRQQTWFKREKDAIRIDRGDFGGDTFRILEHMLSVLKERTGIVPEEVKPPYV